MCLRIILITKNYSIYFNPSGKISQILLVEKDPYLLMYIFFLKFFWVT